MEFLDDQQGRRQIKTNISIYLYTHPPGWGERERKKKRKKKKKRKPDVSKAYIVDYLSNSYHCLLVHLKVL
jgi:hypothetical protein